MGLDGWLFYDFHRRDPIGCRILELDDTAMSTRRWYYFVPARGEPRKLVHRIEMGKLDALPGEKHVYLPWKEQHRLLREMIGPAKRVAMQYSPLNAVPYVSLVDAGTIELVRSFGVEVVSSAELVALFEAQVLEPGFKLHLEAGKGVHAAVDDGFAEIGRRRALSYRIICILPRGTKHRTRK